MRGWNEGCEDLRIPISTSIALGSEEWKARSSYAEVHGPFDTNIYFQHCIFNYIA